MEFTPSHRENQYAETSSLRQRRGHSSLRQNKHQSECLEEFTHKVELLNTNKINKGNAFSNRMIDNIEAVFRSFGGSDGDQMWHKYSTGIDFCAKVYGYCVDFVHTEAYKLLAGMNRSVNVEEEENPKNPMKTKKKVQGTSTLEKNISDISVAKLEKEIQFDPFFKLLSAQFDASNAAGLLLNSVSYNGNIDIILNDDDSALGTLEVQSTASSFKIEANYPSLIEGELSRTISNFENSKIKTNETDQLISILRGMNTEIDMISEDSEDIPCPVVLLESSEPLFGSKDLSSMISMSVKDSIHFIIEDNTYQYFDKPALCNWAGFDFWKKITRRHSVNSETVSRKKRDKKYCIFLEQVDEPTILERPLKIPNYLKEDYYKKLNTQEKPRDYGFSLQRFTRVFDRPCTMVKFFSEEIEMQSKPGSPFYSEEDTLFDLNLEEKIPEKSEDVPLSFALTSKTVDIKKLKEGLWKVHQLSESFLGMLENLTDVLPGQEIDNLSVHSCFISLLHLANEHDLVLETTGTCDFKVQTYN